MGYDGRGNKSQEAYFSAGGAAAVSIDGVASWEATRDGFGRLLRRTTYDALGRETCSVQGYATKSYQRDERGRLTQVAFLDGRGALVEQGTARQQLEYDSKGRLVHISYWGSSGQQQPGEFGLIEARLTFDDVSGSTRLQCVATGARIVSSEDPSCLAAQALFWRPEEM